MATAEAPPGASGSGRDLHSTSPAAGRLAVESSLLPKHVLEARKKFNTAMDDHLLDYKHNHPMHVDNCANTLIRIFSNVLDNPGEAKYRQVKAISNVFKNNVCNVKGGEELMMLAGWKTEVVEMQKFWAFDGEAGSTKFSVLAECKQVLERALKTIHEKAERSRAGKESKAAMEKEQRQKILMAIEDDKLDRKIKEQTTVAVTAAQQEAAAAEAGAGPAAAAGASGAGSGPTSPRGARRLSGAGEEAAAAAGAAQLRQRHVAAAATGEPAGGST